MGIESQMKLLQLQREAKQSTAKLRKVPETKDPKRRFLKNIIKNYFQRDPSNIIYEAADVFTLMEQFIPLMKSQQTLLDLESPIFVCGDIHGQITDLRRIFHICGFPNRKKFLFLGDYVDRGSHSVEVVCVLAALKLLWPGNVHLLRGNHELAHINKEYGFRDEIRSKWIDPSDAERIYRKFNEAFSFFPLAAVIAGKILCMHGGLSPLLDSLEDIRMFRRPIVQPKGLAQDLMWADPMHGVFGFKPNSLRACSVNFGEADVRARLRKLGMSKMIRAHQVVQHGWEAFADGAVITVFSACRYQDDLCNYGAVIDIKKNLGIGIIMIKPSDFDENMQNDPLTVDVNSVLGGKIKSPKKESSSPAKSKDSKKKDKNEKTLRSDRGKTAEDRDRDNVDPKL